jgi:hypothetical protein
MDEQRINELIDFHQQNMKNTAIAVKAMGLPARFADMALGVTTPILEDTIKALKELRDMKSVKKLVDG